METNQSDQDDDDNFSQESTSNIFPICRLNGSPARLLPKESLACIPKRRVLYDDSKSETSNATCNEKLNSLTSRTEPHNSTKREEAKDDLVKEKKVFSNPEFIVSDYWKSPSREIPVKLVELFKESNLDKQDSNVPLKKQKLSLEDVKENLSYTKEFHVLTEVQKAKILTAVEDVIKKLANSSFNDCLYGAQGQPSENASLVSPNLEKYFSKNFLMPWVIMKLVEMILCHVIQLTFLSDDTYFQRKKEFLPVVVTYYFTLFVIIISLIVHISCYSYVGVQNPCYFMGIVSSSILTLTTVLGIFILLFSVEYYKSFRAVLVLVFIGGLVCILVAELCICYIEVKNFWNRMEHAQQYCIP